MARLKEVEAAGCAASIDGGDGGDGGLGSGSDKLGGDSGARGRAQGRAPPLARQFSELLRREWVCNARTPQLAHGKAAITLVTAVLVGAIYFDLPATSPSGVHDRLLCLVMSGVLTSVRISMEVTRLFMKSRR